MKPIQMAGAVIALGLFFLGCAWLWPTVCGDGAVWSDTQAKEFQESAALLHAAAHQRAEAGSPAYGKAHANEPAHESPLSFEEAKARYERSHAQLASARSFQSGPATVLRWIGGILASLGVVGYFVARSMQD